MVTKEELATSGIPVASYEDTDMLYVESALDWLTANTTLEVDKDDIESIRALPAGAKLFISRFREIMSMQVGVTSESVDGLSQSFSDTQKRAMLLDLAEELLAGYMKSNVVITACKSRWK